MRYVEFDQDVRSILQLVDYDVLGQLQVNALATERAKSQRGVIKIIRQITGADPNLGRKYKRILKQLEDPEFNDSWNNKRDLGHVQRCVSSGDLYFFRFGLDFLSLVTKRGIRSLGQRVLEGEGRDTQIAWTVAPLLLAEDRTFSQIMIWVGTGSIEQGAGVHLDGLRFLPVKDVFMLPDRFSTIYRDINPLVAPITTHPNYIAARALAHHLVVNGVV